MPPVLAIDLGGSHISGGVVSAGRFRPLLERRREPHSPAPDLSRFVGELMEAASDDAPTRIGVALAGIVDATHRRVVASENLGDVPADLAAVLERETGVPVFLDTDVFCFGRALADDAPTGTHLMIVAGTGIGHCVVIDGVVREGRGRHANRFGHITVEPGGRACYCGQRGCVCQYSAGPALRALSGTADGLEHAHHMLGRALAAAIQVICPDEVVLAGGPVTAGVLEPRRLAEHAAQHCEPWMVPPLRVLRDTSAVYRGAALLATEQPHPADVPSHQSDHAPSHEKE